MPLLASNDIHSTMLLLLFRLCVEDYCMIHVDVVELSEYYSRAFRQILEVVSFDFGVLAYTLFHI